MRDFAPIIRQQGGAAATHELYARGFTRADLADAVRQGKLWRVRQGWYVLPGTAEHALQAVRIGGVLTCHSALSAVGFWTLPTTRLHVRVPDHDARLRTRRSARHRLSEQSDPSVVVHWRHRAPSRSRLLAHPVTALADLKSCAPRDHYLATLDSVLNLSPRLAPEIAQTLGHPVGHLGIDGVCQSGIETLCWLRLLRGLSAQRQVRIAGVGFVDFLIGERLVIEVDGEQFHNTESTFETDRRRDATLSALGYRVLRFSYRQVVERFDDVELAIRAALARGDHL